MINKISRRDFLKGTAAGVASVAAAGLLGDQAGTASGLKTTITKSADRTPDSELETQVVVVGAGACGLLAALQLAEAGCEVIVLEAGENVGTCNAANAGGPAVADTTIQAEEGETVTVETLFNYMYSFSNCTVNGYLLREVIGNGGEAVNKMVDCGVEMYLREDVYGAGFRARHGFSTGGADRFAPVQAKIEAAGGEFLFQTAGVELIQDDDGAVVGILAESVSDGTLTQINAKAVLIATGGYLGSEEMMNEHFGEVKINPLGNTLSDGTGINMIVDAGGIKDRNWAICGNEFAGSNQKAGGWSFGANQNFKYPIFGGLLVNRLGNRFMDEGLFATKALSIGGEASLREGVFYSIIDETYLNACATEGIWKFLGEPEDEWYVGKMSLTETILSDAPDTVQEAIDQGWGFKADSIEDLAELTGLTNLVDTVEEYNTYCEEGADGQFYKNPLFMTPVMDGPFYAFEYEPSAWCTFGGVKVDEYLRAMKPDQSIIPGLYVGGVDAGSMYTSPYYINEGATLGLAFASGIYAGKKIADFLAE